LVRTSAMSNQHSSSSFRASIPRSPLCSWQTHIYNKACKIEVQHASWLAVSPWILQSELEPWGIGEQRTGPSTDSIEPIGISDQIFYDATSHRGSAHCEKERTVFDRIYIVQHAYRGSETMRWLQLPALLKAFGCIPGEHRLAFKLQKFNESRCHVVFNSRKKTNARTERRLKVLGLIFQDDEQNGWTGGANQAGCNEEFEWWNLASAWFMGL